MPSEAILELTRVWSPVNQTITVPFKLNIDLKYFILKYKAHENVSLETKHKAVFQERQKKSFIAEQKTEWSIFLSMV